MEWPLIGRAREIELLATVLSPDAPSPGVVVAGRAGVGKSRLALEAAANAAKRGWTVQSLEGTAAARDVPLGAFTQWVSRPDENTLNLVGAVIEAVTASPDGAPVLLMVDDAHLLDDLSAFVLHQLVRRRKAVVIATLRTGERAPETVTALWKDNYLRRLDLSPLARPECDELLEAVLAGPVDERSSTRIWELTHGNVLFLHQLVRQELETGRLSRDDAGRWQWTGSVTVSPTLAELVEAFIGSTPGPVLEVLDLVTVAEPLELGYLSALADPAAIEEAERRELICVSHDGPTETVRIGHPLYGETRRARMGAVRARRLRGRIATMMAEPGFLVAEPNPIRLGLLWLDSDLPRNPDVLYCAGALAFRRMNMALSERFAEAASLAGAGPDAVVLQARALAMMGKAEDSGQLLDSLPRKDISDFLWVAATTLRALNLLLSEGRPEESWAVIDDALTAAPQSVIDEVRAFRALQLAMAARPAEVVTLAESIDREKLEPRPRISLNFGLTIALGELGRPQPATQAPEDALVLATNTPVSAYQAVALALIHADALVTNGCVDDALRMGQRLGETWENFPKVPQRIAVAINGVAALGHGDLRTAQRLLHAALARQELTEDDGGLPYLGVAY